MGGLLAKISKSHLHSNTSKFKKKQKSLSQIRSPSQVNKPILIWILIWISEVLIVSPRLHNLKFESARFESSIFKFRFNFFKFQSGPKPSEPNSARRGAEEPGKPGGEKEVDQVNKSAPNKNMFSPLTRKCFQGQ